MAARHDLSPQALEQARRRLARPGTTRGTGLTPRIRKAVEAFVHGIPGLPVDQVVTRKVAADYAGIKERSFALALLKPAVDQYFHAQMKALRVGERPQNVRALVAIRDDASLKGSAAGARARVAAVAQLEVDPDVRAGINVNINSTVNVTERAGYVIDLSAHPADAPLVIEHDDDPARDRVVLAGPDPYEGAALPLRAAGGAQRGVGGKIRPTTPSSSLAHATHPLARPR